jgi:hypothetical protein
MIRQVLKILWKQRRSRSGIFTEQLLVTIVLMIALVSVADLVKKYKTDGLLNVENLVWFTCMTQWIPPEKSSEIHKNIDIIIERLRKTPFVESITRASNLAPYMRPDQFYSHLSDSIHIDDKHFSAVIKVADEFGATVFKPHMKEGMWFENHELPDGSSPVVITRQFADKAGWIHGTGKNFTLNGRNFTVTGTVVGLKQESFTPSPVAIVIPYYLRHLYRSGIFAENIARVKSGMEQEFIDAFYNEYQRLISDERVEPIVNNMQSMQGAAISLSIIEIVLQSILTLFLFLFAFIGTFGLYWMISRKRLKEFALRIALGSDKTQLVSILIIEGLIVTTMAVIPALVLSFFIYEYTLMHVVAVSITILVMLLFSFVSACYPAWQVARVNPAEALQYE